ncbi:hypothetical protein HVC08_002307 [Salmonella enterica]|nr:hypothetical protein [Salmonella enterica]
MHSTTTLSADIDMQSGANELIPSVSGGAAACGLMLLVLWRGAGAALLCPAINFLPSDRAGKSVAPAIPSAPLPAIPLISTAGLQRPFRSRRPVAP